MNLSELCVRRPVATGLLAVAAVVLGIVAYFGLPVASLPRVDFPIINVSANLPGASPEVMAASVATPLEREFTTIAGVEAITSTSGQGSTSITLQFTLERDIDAAAQDVQAALARAARRLPEEMTTPPSFRKVNPADAPVLMLALTSPTVPLAMLNDFAENMISPRVSRLTGVAQVLVYGAQKYAVRIRLDPDALAARGLALSDVQSAVAAANANTPMGVLNGPKQQIILQGSRQLDSAAAFRGLIVAWRGGAPVRLDDVAEVVDSVENTRTASWFNNDRSIVLAVQRQPDANTVEVVDRVKDLLPRFAADLPATVKVNVVNDRSRSIRAAVADVRITLGITIMLVVLVIFLFLRRVTATLIPAVAVPISLLVTFAAMRPLGFSIDNISLLGLTLAVGLVVDDAIVMLENIHRHIEAGESPFVAAIRGAKEIGFTIASITLSLVAVFIPLFAMGGVVGRVFYEFAMVVTIAIVASAVVSLTLTPAMCSRLLRPEHGSRPEGRFGRACEAGYLGMLWLYDRTLRASLKVKPLVLVVLLATIAGSGWLAISIPKGFFPLEDTGQIVVGTEAAQDISFPAMVEQHRQVVAALRAHPAVDVVTSSVAGGLSNAVNSSRAFIQLKPRGERPPIGEVIQQLRRQLGGLPGIRAYVTPIQNLHIGGRSSKSQYQYTLQGIDQDELFGWAQRMTAEMRRLPLLQDVVSDLNINSPQAVVEIDRDRAAALGIGADAVRSALYSAFGARQVATIYTAANDYAVIIEAAPEHQRDIGALDQIRLRGADGRLVPLSAFATVRMSAGPLTIAHQSQLPAVTISFDVAPGTSLGQAVEAVHALEGRLGLPATVVSSFEGAAQVFQQASANQGLLLLAAVAVIYVVLGVLYESLIHPLTILSGIPAAAVGALATLMLFGQELSIIAVIGILMLIGIVKKNAIMMVDFALDAQRRHQLPPEEAILRACRLRFRPIMMTTMAAIMGVLPIAVGHGAAAELRQPLGLAVVGGLIASQILTLYITPVLYIYFERLSDLLRRRPAPVAAPMPASTPAPLVESPRPEPVRTEGGARLRIGNYARPDR